MKIRTTLGVLILLACIASACRPAIQPLQATRRVADAPYISLSPAFGASESTITVSGAGFPGAETIDFYIGLPNAGTTARPIASAQSAADGSFSANITLPAAWSDGKPMTEPQLVIVAANQDFSVRATATFNLGANAGSLQPYFNAEGGFTLSLPAEWTVSGPQDSPLGRQYLLGPAPLGQGTTASRIIIADAASLSIRQAIDLLCSGACATPPILEASGLIPAQVTTIGGNGAQALEWYFVQHESHLIYFSIHDADTLQTLDAVIQTFSLGAAADALPTPEPAVEAARQALARELGISPYLIMIQSFDHAEWPDACLGLRVEGEACAEVVTPGYVGLLETRSQQVEFRADANGSQVRLIPGAALSARQVLMQQLGLDVDAVHIAGVERVEWPDACLGIATAGSLCAQVVTPGYKIVLEAEGRRYEYHADESGANLRLAAAPEAEIEDAAIVWTQDSDGACQTAIIGGQDVAFGSCQGALVLGRLVAEMDRPAELASFVGTYASFEAVTPAGTVKFTGKGTAVATPAERRMIAEWARLAQMEAAGGRSGASYGLAFAWHREGGIAGFCDDVSVYITGAVVATSCTGAQPTELGRLRLTAVQLEQMYAWIDRLQSFEFEHTDPAVADAMTVRLVFMGAGTASATDADIQSIQQFASDLLAGLRK